MASKQAKRQAITLKGSCALVTEFFKYAVNTFVLQQWLACILSHNVASFSREKYIRQMTFIWSKNTVKQYS